MAGVARHGLDPTGAVAQVTHGKARLLPAGLGPSGSGMAGRVTRGAGGMVKCGKVRQVGFRYERCGSVGHGGAATRGQEGQGLFGYGR